MKISKYGTFGIHQEWVEQFLVEPETFWNDNLLGKKQVPSFKAWLKDAEIIDDKLVLTDFGRLCKKVNEESYTLMWELIYINLSYNSPMMSWYVSSINFDKDIERKALDKMALEYFEPTFKETTILYAVQALIQSFKYSPIGEEFNQFVLSDAKGLIFKRNAYNDLSPEALAYSIYRFGKSKGINLFRVSDLYRKEEETGAYREFGIAKSDLLKKLRYLSTEKNRVLVAELNMGLEHITLREDLTPVSVVETLIK